MGEKIKLKSSIMIEQYSGYNELNIEDIGKEFDLSYLDANVLNQEERQELEKDLLNIIKQCGSSIHEIRLPQGVKTIIPEVLKQASTEHISFDGSEEYFERMKNTTFIKSDDANYNKFDFMKKDEISEYDLFLFLKTHCFLDDEYRIKNIQEYEDVQRYLPDNFKLIFEVRNEEELKEIIARKHANTSLNINKNDIKNFEKIDNGYDVQIQIENMSELTIKELVELKSKYNVKKIDIASDNCSDISSEKNEKINQYGRCYDTDTYAKLRREIDEIIKDIDVNSPEIEKFTKIYERLGYKIQYDHEEYEYNKTDGAEGRKNVNAHNLIGALLENLSVCEGISKTLEQALRLCWN